jgi:hypothetical protein
MWFDELTTLRGLEGRIISFIDQPEVIKKNPSTLGSMGRVPSAAGQRHSNERDYLRSILRFDKLTVPRKIEGQPGYLRAALPQPRANVHP